MPRIAATADLHFDRRGYLTPPAVVDDLVLRLQVAEPEAVIIAGDLGHPSGDFAGCLAAFRRLSVPVAVLAGNHDVWRDEQGWSSRELWERRLPSLVKEVGFIWLEDSVLRVGEVAVVGSLSWYDYSAAPASLQFPPEYFAAMKKNLNNDAAWIDWPWSDVEFAAVLRDGLEGCHPACAVTLWRRTPASARWWWSRTSHSSWATQSIAVAREAQLVLRGLQPRVAPKAPAVWLALAFGRGQGEGDLHGGWNDSTAEEGRAVGGDGNPRSLVEKAAEDPAPSVERLGERKHVPFRRSWQRVPPFV